MVICIQLENFQRQSGCDLCAPISVVLVVKQKRSKKLRADDHKLHGEDD